MTNSKKFEFFRGLLSLEESATNQEILQAVWLWWHCPRSGGEQSISPECNGELPTFFINAYNYAKVKKVLKHVICLQHYKMPRIDLRGLMTLYKL